MDDPFGHVDRPAGLDINADRATERHAANRQALRMREVEFESRRSIRQPRLALRAILERYRRRITTEIAREDRPQIAAARDETTMEDLSSKSIGPLPFRGVERGLELHDEIVRRIKVEKPSVDHSINRLEVSRLNHADRLGHDGSG